MNFIGSAVVLAAVAVLAACNATTRSDTFVAGDYQSKPKSLLVAYYLESDPQILDASRFQDRFAAGLAQCGVKSRAAKAPNGSYGGFPSEHVSNATADVDAILVVSMGNNGMGRFAEAMMGGRRGETGQNYQVALFDRKTMTRVWATDMNVHGSAPLQVLKPAEKADNFARDLVGALAADGVVPTCPKAG